MATPKEMDVVRRAYELWQQAGEPSGKDDEFYHQAKKELQEALDRKPTPPGITKNALRMALLLDGTDTKVSLQAAYRGLKDPTVGAPILDRAAQRRFAILVTLRQR